jgi:hypothetical protein
MNEARYLNGPDFVRFLIKHGIDMRGLDKKEKSLYGGWKRGISRVDLLNEITDAMLTRYGIPTSSIPEGMEHEYQGERYNVYSRENNYLKTGERPGMDRDENGRWRVLNE